MGGCEHNDCLIVCCYTTFSKGFFHGDNLFTVLFVLVLLTVMAVLLWKRTELSALIRSAPGRNINGTRNILCWESKYLHRKSLQCLRKNQLGSITSSADATRMEFGQKQYWILIGFLLLLNCFPNWNRLSLFLVPNSLSSEDDCFDENIFIEILLQTAMGMYWISKNKKKTT